MKIFGKSKASPKSNTKTGPEPAEIVALMTKIVERLDALEKKTDLVLGQTSSRPFERQGNFRSGFSQHKSDNRRHREEPPLLRFAKQSDGGDVAISLHKSEIVSPQESTGARNDIAPHSQGHSQGRREKILHKAVCADCHKDCEIPFKPTGERPVYCKECFSKRKAGNPVKANNGNGQEPLSSVPGPLNSPQRQVSVTKKGVGKVTVSEVVQPSGHDASPKNKNHTPEKRSKRS